MRIMHGTGGGKGPGAAAVRCASPPSSLTPRARRRRGGGLPRHGPGDCGAVISVVWSWHRPHRRASRRERRGSVLPWMCGMQPCPKVDGAREGGVGGVVLHGRTAAKWGPGSEDDKQPRPSSRRKGTGEVPSCLSPPFLLEVGRSQGGPTATYGQMKVTHDSSLPGGGAAAAAGPDPCLPPRAGWASHLPWAIHPSNAGLAFVPACTRHVHSGSGGVAAGRLIDDWHPIRTTSVGHTADTLLLARYMPPSSSRTASDEVRCRGGL